MGSRSSKNKNLKNNELKTVEVPKPYSTDSYVEYIGNALNRDCSHDVIRCFLECSEEQRQQLVGQIPELFLKCESKFTSLDSYIIKILLTPTIQIVVEEMKRLIVDKHKQPVIELICGMSQSIGLKVIVLEYNKNDTNSLEKDLQTVCEPLLFDLLNGMCLHCIENKTDEATVSVDEVSDKLVEAAKDHRLFSEDQLFVNICINQDIEQMASILDQFLKKCQRDISVEIQKSDLDDQVKLAFTTVVEILHNPLLYQVNKIHENLESNEPDCLKWLIFLLFIQSPDDLKELKQVYRNTYFSPLPVDIKDNIKDEAVKTALLKLVK